MHIEVKNYTYDEMPEFNEEVEGAHYIQMTGEEVGLEYHPNIIYNEEHNLHLYMIIPTSFNHPKRRYPCIVYIQGSAWRKQRVSIKVPYLSALAKKGYVIAIVEYRDSSIGHFPCCIEDGKNAIRFMQAHKEDYPITDQFIVAGDSSGGHTSAMIGVTAGLDLFGGKVNIQGCIDLYGCVEVTFEEGFPTTLNHQRPDSPEGMYLGYDILEHLEEAKKANVKTYVQDLQVPMLIAHGTKDRQVFCEHSVRLYKALKEAHKDVTLYLIKGADHGGAAFFTNEMIDVYDSFIQRCLGHK